MSRVTELLQWLCAVVEGGGAGDAFVRIVVHALLKDRAAVVASCGDAAAAAAAAAAADAAAAAAETVPSSVEVCCICPLLSALVQVTCVMRSIPNDV
jgi:hypothetical protein